MSIRRYCKDDHPKLLDLIRSVYDDHVYQKTVKRFQWQFVENPHNTPDDPLIFVLEHEDKFIGMIATTAQRLKVADQIYPAYWVGDFMVHPAHRHKFHATHLANALTRQPFLMMGFPAGYTIKFWLRQQWVPFSHLVEYTRMTRPDFLYKHKFFRFCYACYDNIKYEISKKISKGVSITPIQYFDERFDQLWQKITPEHIICQVRDSRFLNWRFFKCPYLSYEVLAAVQDDEVVGYIVFRYEDNEGLRHGFIVDLLASRSSRLVVSALLQSAIRALKRLDCDRIKMFISGDDRVLADCLLAHSFFKDKRKEQGIFYNNTRHDLNAAMQESEHWSLSRADSDMDLS